MALAHQFKRISDSPEAFSKAMDLARQSVTTTPNKEAVEAYWNNLNHRMRIWDPAGMATDELYEREKLRLELGAVQEATNGVVDGPWKAALQQLIDHRESRPLIQGIRDSFPPVPTKKLADRKQAEEFFQKVSQRLFELRSSTPAIFSEWYDRIAGALSGVDRIIPTEGLPEMFEKEIKRVFGVLPAYWSLWNGSRLYISHDIEGRDIEEVGEHMKLARILHMPDSTIYLPMPENGQLNVRGVRVFSRDVRRVERIHPHVGSGGDLCYGTSLDIAYMFARDLRYLDIVELIQRDLLPYWSDRNPYWHPHDEDTYNDFDWWTFEEPVEEVVDMTKIVNPFGAWNVAEQGPQETLPAADVCKLPEAAPAKRTRRTRATEKSRELAAVTGGISVADLEV